jgi:hypothetical protein
MSLEKKTMDDINFARSDISFNGEKYNFSYRVAGILVRDNKVLLQKPNNAAELLSRLDGGVEHFVYREETVL